MMSFAHASEIPPNRKNLSVGVGFDNFPYFMQNICGIDNQSMLAVKFGLYRLLYPMS